jgi:hypothetical protein
MHFVPNTSKAYQPVTFQTLRQNVKILKNKQKCFLACLTRIPSCAIQQLDFHIPTLNMTLQGAVMKIQAQEIVAPLFGCQ